MKISERIPHTEHTLRLQAGKKVYFVSDVHLGAPVLDNDRERYASLRTRAYLYISLRVITISGHSVISRKNAA